MIPGVDAWVPCRGGCGDLVHPGQKCRECADAAVNAAVERKKIEKHKSRKKPVEAADYYES